MQMFVRALYSIQNGFIKKWELEAYACCPCHLNQPLMTVHLWCKITVIVPFCQCCEVQSEYFIPASWHCPSNFVVQGGHIVCLVGRGKSANVRKRATKSDKTSWPTVWEKPYHGEMGVMALNIHSVHASGCSVELNRIWVRALQGPIHLGLKTGPLCPMFFTKLKEPCSFSKVPDGPYT